VASLETVFRQDGVLQEDDGDQDWHLELDCFVVEDHLLFGRHREEQPGDTGTTCHLENLWGVGLSERDLLVRQLTLEYLKSNLEVLELLHVSERYSDWVDEHWNQTEVGSKDRSSNVICEPDDHVSIRPNPKDTNEQGQRIIVVISLTKGTWDREILSVSKWHQEKVFQDIFRCQILATRARDVESLLVDCFIHKLVDDGLWD